MRSQFDELAKALAQGVSRRRALRAVLGGLVGAVAVTILPGGLSDTVEADAPAAGPPVHLDTDVNQRPPNLHQAGSGSNAGPNLNQAPARLNQSSAGLNRGRRDPHALLNQYVQSRKRTVSSQARRHVDQQGLSGNQRLRPGVNQVRARFNQADPRSNQHGAPFWNQTRSR